MPHVIQDHLGVTLNISVNQQGLWEAGSGVETQVMVTLGFRGNK